MHTYFWLEGAGRTAEMLRRDEGCNYDSGPTGIGDIFKTWKDFFQAISLIDVISCTPSSAGANGADQ